MNADTLKKHHYWILAGIAPVLALLAFVLILTGAGSAIEEKSKLIATDLDTVSKTRPKGTKAFEDFDKQKALLEVKREELWKKNYDEQKKLFSWPGTNALLKGLEKKFAKFGEPIIPQANEFEIFKRTNIYQAAYEDLAKSVEPVRFQGSWQNVFRHVSDWGTRNPTSKQIWLALEDLWVQRGLIQPIITVNKESARFVLLPDPQTGQPPKDLTKRSFASKLWRLDLEVTDNGPNKSKVIECKVTNLTDRLLPLGSGGAMRLNIWLSDAEREQPIEYRIQGLFVKGRGVIEIRSTFPDSANDPARAKAKRDGDLVEVKVNPNLHGIPVTSTVEQLARVEQILDQRTVPIQRIENIELGYKDARHTLGTLIGPEWWPEPEVAATSGDGMGMGGEGMGMPGMGAPGGEGPAMGPGMGVGGPGGFGAGSGAARAKRGGPLLVLDANRQRYLTVTGQVRRMPVALVLLVDQQFIQETLIAYSNATLRFQVTQVHWNRFRGTLTNPTDSGMSGSGMFGSEGDGMMPPLGGVGPGGPGSGGPGMGGPPGFGPPSGGDGKFDDSGSMGSGPGMPGMPGMPGGIGGYGGFGANSTATEGQLTAGLVELTIYGIITLYEKYEKSSESGSTAGEGTPMSPDNPGLVEPTDGAPPVGPGTPATPPGNPDAPVSSPDSPTPPANPAGTPAGPSPPAPGNPPTPNKD